jgi:uncharacterized lipoprotein YddW (UPF0748 family)
MASARALWVVRHNIATSQGVDRLVELAGRYGYTDLIAQVRGRGDALYESALEPRSEMLKDPRYDPLAYLLKKAHEAEIKVHAWLNGYYIWSAATLPWSQDHIMRLHPDWLMVHQSGRPMQRTDYEGYYTCPSQPLVQAHVWRVLMDVTQRYAVDGIHLDYIRYPGPEFCYCPTCQRSFLQSVVGAGFTGDLEKLLAENVAHYGAAWPDQAAHAEAWGNYRRQQVTDLLGAIYHGIKRVKPQVCVSVAVIANPVEAAKSRFQDWPAWAQQGILDLICPMCYSPETQLVETQTRDALALAGTTPVWAGLGAWQAPPASIVEKVAAVRDLGVAGFVLFSYGSMTKDVADETYFRSLKAGGL